MADDGRECSGGLAAEALSAPAGGRADPGPAAPWDRLRELLHRLTGISLSEISRTSALRVLDELAARRGLAPSAFLELAAHASGGSEGSELVDALVTTTTWFFRERAGIEHLVSSLARARAPGARVDVWVAGCSTGQEAYGLAAALLAAGLQPALLATDVSEAALATAATGAYPARAFRDASPAWLARYFTDEEGGLRRVRPEVRRCVRFRRHNLASGGPPEPRPFDAVVCRNVLIYFDPASAVAVLEVLAGACRGDGWLLLGAAEQPLTWSTERVTGGGELPYLFRPCAGRAPGHRGSLLPQGRPVIAPSRPALARAPAPVAASSLAGAVPASPPSLAGAVPASPPGPEADAVREAEALLEQGHAAEALVLMDREALRAPFAHEPQLLRGLILKRLGRPLEAVQALRCARFLVRDESWLPSYQLAVCLEQLGELRDAFEHYRQALVLLTRGAKPGLPHAEEAGAALTASVVGAAAISLGRLAPLVALPLPAEARSIVCSSVPSGPARPPARPDTGEQKGREREE